MTAEEKKPFHDRAGAKKIKRARTAYSLYSSSVHKEVSSSHPGLGFGEVSKKIGESWKKMTAEEKKPFVEKSDAEKIVVKAKLEEAKRLIAAKEVEEGEDTE